MPRLYVGFFHAFGDTEEAEDRREETELLE
jgi:hypothetical protein